MTIQNPLISLDNEELKHALYSSYHDILIQGETGTGKDTLAYNIYKQQQFKGDFVAVNAAAIPDALIESELFGTVAGAYTGATNSRLGYVEAAHDGILYLDEIDSLPLHLQVKLLRVIETRSLQRLGSTKTLQLNFRIIASSQRNLFNLTQSGLFRGDLYYRLMTLKVNIPPLRERAETILPMFKIFLKSSSCTNGVHPPNITAEVEDALLMYSWPGNIRELKSCADRFSLGLPIFSQPISPTGIKKLKERVSVFERSVINSCLEKYDGNMKEVAEELAVTVRTIYNKLQSQK